MRTPAINCIIEREVAITLCYQLCFSCYTVLQMKYTTRSVSAINPVTMEIRAIANAATGKLQCAITNLRLALSAKRTGNGTKEDTGSPRCVYF